MIPPSQIHVMEQFQALMRDFGASLAAYREELRAGGFSEAEIYALCRRVESQVLGGAFDDAERILAEERRQRESLTKPPEPL